ncbi:MAG: hypothetical protein ACYDEN_02865 [Acidimicrobiales bacterium]
MGEDRPRSVSRVRDGRAWRIGTAAEVAWIGDGTSTTKAITAAIPPVFDAFATLELPEWTDDAQQRHDDALLALLSRYAMPQPWWLGYLDTGADDIVFPDAPPVTLYAGWPYVLVEAGPPQAAEWRRVHPASFWKGALPNLMFPADRSWLASTLWDDDWTCIGGLGELVDDLLRDPELGPRARRVALDHDATPPGHRAW